jgi:hypothetical protein
MNHVANAGATRVEHRPDSGAVRVGHFLRHLGEMILAMMIGMVAGGAGLVLIFSTLLAPTIGAMTRVEVLNQFAVLICLVMATGMTLPMVGWMRFRGMAWRPVREMAVAMVIPLVPIFGLLALGMIPGASACGLYSAVMIPAMVLAMLLRLDLYTTGHARHLAHAT